MWQLIYQNQIKAYRIVNGIWQLERIYIHTRLYVAFDWLTNSLYIFIGNQTGGNKWKMILARLMLPIHFIPPYTYTHLYLSYRITSPLEPITFFVNEVGQPYVKLGRYSCVLVQDVTAHHATRVLSFQLSSIR